MSNASPKAAEFKIIERNGRLTASSGSPWEPKIGYSRAIKCDRHIYVSGTVGIEPDKTFNPDVAAQARRSLQIIKSALEALDANLSCVVMTRMYVTNIADWEKVAAVHGEFFGNVRPATVMVQVAKLIDDAALVEIEATAVVP